MTSATKGPVIGIAGHGYVVPMPFGELAVNGATRWYADAIQAAGGRPVIVPPRAGIDLLDVVDALVLTGGGDVDPARYGGAPGTATGVDADRDQGEIDLVHAAAAAGLPLLGVCRGLQILAVAYGGTLTAGVEHIHPFDGHAVRTAPGSLIRRLVGERPITSALHRQAVSDPGSQWRATAWAEDGTVEAIEPALAGWQALAVQWHPELHWHDELDDATGPALFGWLVETARNRQHSPATPQAVAETGSVDLTVSC